MLKGKRINERKKWKEDKSIREGTKEWR